MHAFPGFLFSPLRRGKPFNETFPTVSQVLLCHQGRGKENQQNRQLHTNSTGKR